MEWYDRQPVINWPEDGAGVMDSNEQWAELEQICAEKENL